MKLNKKNGGFKKFIEKAGSILPEILNIGASALSGNIFGEDGAISKVGDILKNKAEGDENAKALLQEFERFEKEWRLEAYKEEVKDREGARSLYMDDSLAQKILAVVFIIAYFALMGVLMNFFFNGKEELNDYELGFLSTLFGGMSTKVGTIMDFFFGGSV